MARAGSRVVDRRRVLTAGLAIFVVAWILRVLYVRELQASPLAEVPLLDELYHVRWARAIAAGDWVGSGVFFQAPLYAYVLGVALKLVHGGLLAARVFQATYGALTPVVVYLLGRRMLTERGALFAGAIAAAYPFFLYFDNEFHTASLAVLLDVLLMLAIVRADEVPGRGRWALAGILMGLSALARPEVLTFIPVLLIWIWWRARGDATRRSARRVDWSRLSAPSPLGTALLRSATVVLGAVLVISPVTIRNYAQERDFVPIAASGGLNFFMGNNADADGVSAVVPALGGAWKYADMRRIAESAEGRELKSSEVSAYWYRQGRSFVLGSPGASARLFLKKLVLFWNRYELPNDKDVYFFANMSRVYKGLSWLSFGLIAPFALLGAWVSRRHRVGLLMVLFVLAHMATVVAFFVNSRFRLPAVPFLIVLALAGIRWLVERWKGGERRTFALGATAVALLALFSNLGFYGVGVADSANTHNTVGLALASQGKHEMAVEEFRRAIEDSPGSAMAYNNLGLSLEQLGREEEAYRAYLEAVERDKSLEEAPNNLGTISRAHGDLEGAARWFREALARNPQMYQAHYNLAGVLAVQGDLDGAIEQCRLALTANPDLKEAWNGLGTLYEEKGNLPDAMTAFSRAIQIDPRFVDARVNLASVLSKAGRQGEAVSELETALRADPNNPTIQDRLREAQELAGAR